jgi:hypothetical protein
MIQYLQNFPYWVKKSSSNIAFMAISLEETDLTSTIINVNDTYVSNASKEVEVIWR